MHHLLVSPLCMFCCAHNLTPELDKLNAQAIKCVFLWYSRLQKAYWCYFPVTLRYYMSTNATFFKKTTYFSPSVKSKFVSETLLFTYFGPFSSLLKILSPDSSNLSPKDTNEVPSSVTSEPSFIVYQRWLGILYLNWMQLNLVNRILL